MGDGFIALAGFRTFGCAAFAGIPRKRPLRGRWGKIWQPLGNDLGFVGDRVPPCNYLLGNDHLPARLDRVGF